MKYLLLIIVLGFLLASCGGDANTEGEATPEMIEEIKEVEAENEDLEETIDELENSTEELDELIEDL